MTQLDDETIEVIARAPAIPYFESIEEIERKDDVSIFIARDPRAGAKSRYSVIWLDHFAGSAECIAREVELGLARDLSAIVRKNVSSVSPLRAQIAAERKSR